jgi:DNA-binding MarR family transcriptional regulator
MVSLDDTHSMANGRLPTGLKFLHIPAEIMALELNSTEVVAIALIHVLSKRGDMPCRYTAKELAHMIQLSSRQMKRILANYTECFVQKRRVKRRLLPDLDNVLKADRIDRIRKLVHSRRNRTAYGGKIRFSGVKMSDRIFNCEDLTWTEKLLVASIDSMTNKFRGCFASSEHLADQIGVNNRTVVNLLSSLSRRGFLITQPHGGRIVWSDLSLHSESLSKKEDRRKDRPKNQREVEDFCKEIGLPRSDGEYFYLKWETKGYITGTAKIKDWRSIIRTWKILGFCPSQKHETHRRRDHDV